MNTLLSGYGAAEPTSPEKLVTIGVHNPVTLLLRFDLDADAVDVHTPDKPHRKLGRVIRLASGEPQCVLKGKHRDTLSKYRIAALRYEALAFYCTLVDLPGALRPRALPVPMPPGPWSKALTINDQRVLFTPDLKRRSVSLHTETSARLLGEVVEVDGDSVRLWLTGVWLQVFGFADVGADVASAASHIWYAEAAAGSGERP
ncbi:hypothetical protein [Glycomyces sp. NPDC048151]|uniref:hypothetical protein n=1 Tax=Glycomyces sp. NPDC048151 TaxID=3364002 RepID=UPI003714FAD2